MAAIAGTTRRRSVPRNAPRQNPVSVQAAYTMPRVSNTAGLKMVTFCVVRNGVKSQVNSWLTGERRDR